MDKIHMAFTDGHPRDVTTNSIYYACLDENSLTKGARRNNFTLGLQYLVFTISNCEKRFFQFFPIADGSVIAPISDLPVTPKQTDVVYNGKRGRAWIWDLAIDNIVSLNYMYSKCRISFFFFNFFSLQDHSPVLVYVRFPNFKNIRDHRYHYVRRISNSWEDTEIVAAGQWFPQTLQVYNIIIIYQ